MSRSGHWNIAELRRFMVIFGLVSSVFDVVGFLFLLKLLHSAEPQFQTAWFTLSLLTQTLVVLSLRSRGLAFRNRPSPLLLGSLLAIVALAVAIPQIAPLRAVFGFVPLSLTTTLALFAITALYLAVAETTKLWFYRRLAPRAGG